eukprot:TRINITY_DN17361_c0_g1_i1.p1 TRINITY_DN17361_c0_g1~~TRINITY_DN17361_c0_g1_i1.p1  ORF type:complete len:396 (-),score=94.99 TRINITY_DN17361_c0_g1_i1:59-1246(-)
MQSASLWNTSVLGRSNHRRTPITLRSQSSQGIRTLKNRPIKKGLAGPVQYITKWPEKLPVYYPTEDAKTGWSIDSKRTGVVAVKKEMINRWDEWGVRLPITVLHVPSCQVTQVKTKEVDGFSAIQVAAGAKKIKQLTKTQLGHLAAAGVPPKAFFAEFRTTPDAAIPVGTEINASHFVAGQKVDIIGTSKGKGFQGGMKRWGFHGNNATHGASLSHRSIGATGARQDPGRVWKGKKMPGRMGGKRCTEQALEVFAVKPHANEILLIGSVPGAYGTWVRVKDHFKYRFEVPPPFPTMNASAIAALPEEIRAKRENHSADPKLTDPQQLIDAVQAYRTKIGNLTPDVKDRLYSEFMVLPKGRGGGSGRWSNQTAIQDMKARMDKVKYETMMRDKLRR